MLKYNIFNCVLRPAVLFNGLLDTGEPVYLTTSSFGSQFDIYSQFHSLYTVSQYWHVTIFQEDLINI
jgi:hypothetical protein